MISLHKMRTKQITAYNTDIYQNNSNNILIATDIAPKK